MICSNFQVSEWPELQFHLAENKMAKIITETWGQAPQFSTQTPSNTLANI